MTSGVETSFFTSLDIMDQECEHRTPEEGDDGSVESHAEFKCQLTEVGIIRFYTFQSQGNAPNGSDESQRGNNPGHVADWVIAQIKAVPKSKEEIEESGYTQSVLFVRQDNYVVVRGVRWVHKKNRNKYMDVKKLEKIEGIWVATEMHMTTKSGKKTLHSTVIRQKNTHFNQNSVNEELFTIRRLEKGL